MWLGESRGYLVDWSTQRWVQATGRRVTLADVPWLDGPIGSTTGIGREFFDAYAAQHALRLERGRPAGLLPSFPALAGPEFDPRAVSPAVATFYERTSEYEVDAWSHWCGAFRPFGWALAILFSRRLEQLNVPLSGLDTSHGMTSDVISVIAGAGDRSEPGDGHLFTAWVRELVGTGRLIYSGAYSTCEVPGYRGRCVRVVFPLPNGNAIVIMRPVSNADGSLALQSVGRGFGSPGFYFTVHGRDGVVWARYLKSFRETIRVYGAGEDVRADHTLTLFGVTFLRLHYRLRRGRKL